MMDKYNQERDAVSALWTKNQFLKSTSLDIDLDRYKCKGITGKLYTLIHNAVQNMQQTYITEEIKMADLQNVFNLALNISSLQAMHDYTADFLRHTAEDCIISSDLIEDMENVK